VNHTGPQANTGAELVAEIAALTHTGSQADTEATLELAEESSRRRDDFRARVS